MYNGDKKKKPRIHIEIRRARRERERSESSDNDEEDDMNQIQSMKQHNAAQNSNHEHNIWWRNIHFVKIMEIN